MKETGHVVLEDEWSGDIAMIRAMVDTGNYKTHIIDGVPDVVIAGCDEGILEPIDWDKLGMTPDDFLPGAGTSVGLARSAGRPFMRIEVMCSRMIPRRTGRTSGMSRSIPANAVCTRATPCLLWNLP